MGHFKEKQKSFQKNVILCVVTPYDNLDYTDEESSIQYFDFAIFTNAAAGAIQLQNLHHRFEKKKKKIDSWSKANAFVSGTRGLG